MFLKALAAFLVLPGIVAFAVPLALAVAVAPGPVELHFGGLALLVPGLAGLFWCVRDFYVAGRGTLAPWAPPRNLVDVGLYRFSRNPMYVAVLLIIGGWAVLFGSTAVALYALATGVGFHLRVVYGEEPWLARTHGASWDEYAGRVRRWF
jgi:protein-S-isoprenylcysteine O-methyltransferase Ste14